MARPHPLRPAAEPPLPGAAASSAAPLRGLAFIFYPVDFGHMLPLAGDVTELLRIAYGRC